MRVFLNSIIVVLVAVGPLLAQVPSEMSDDAEFPESETSVQETSAEEPALPRIVPGTLYMVDFANPSHLYRVDAAKGGATDVGTTSWKEVTDIAFYGSTLYGVTYQKFLWINPTTGAASLIGRIGASDVNALAVQPATGKVFAAGYDKPGYLLVINPNTGRGKSIGRFGEGLSSAGDLVFKNGVLYATLNKSGSSNSWLARISTANGKAILIGDTGFRDVWGLAVKGGNLFGATRDGRILRINPITGIATFVGRNRRQQAGLTTSPAAARIAFETGAGS